MSRYNNGVRIEAAAKAVRAGIAVMTSERSDLTLLVVQHCQSEHHIGDMTGGWTDSPLTEVGQQQAAKVALGLAARLDRRPVPCYSSDLLRASQTTEVIGRDMALNVVVEPDLRERNNGAATGKTKEWAAKNAASRPPRGQGLDHRPFAGAETPREFFGRVTNCVDRLVSTAEHELLLVTHGGVVRAIIAWWLGMSVEQYDLTSFATEAASITTLAIDGWGCHVLLDLGNRSHLDDGSEGLARSP